MHGTDIEERKRRTERQDGDRRAARKICCIRITMDVTITESYVH